MAVIFSNHFTACDTNAILCRGHNGYQCFSSIRCDFYDDRTFK